MWRRVAALIVKEFLALWQDKKSRVVLIVPPILQLLVFGYAATFDVSHVKTAIYNEDHSAIAEKLVARFQGSPHFSIVKYLTREGQIASTIDTKEALLVLHIGPEFSRDLLAGRPAKVQAILDGRDSNTALIVYGYVSRIVDAFSTQWSESAGLSPPPATLVVRSWFNPNLESRWFIVPGIIALLTLVVVTVVTALAVAREREIGTFEQLLVTPLTPFEILLGKAIPPLLIGIAEGTLITLVAVFWFDVPMVGNIALLYAGLLVYLLAATGVGLMVSSFCRTQQQAILGAFLFIVPSVILSGFATPIANMPVIVQDITFANPMRYFLVIIRGVFLEGLSARIIFQELWPMAVIAVLTLTGASWLFRHRTA